MKRSMLEELMGLMPSVCTRRRAYYFAFAALGWFVHPLMMIASSLLMVLVLARRQLGSETARALREHVACMRDGG